MAAGLRVAAGLAVLDGLAAAGFGFARLRAGRAGRFSVPLFSAAGLEALAGVDLPTLEAAGLLAAGLELLDERFAAAGLVVAGSVLRCADAERDGAALLRDSSACAAAFSTCVTPCARFKLCSASRLRSAR